MKLRRMLPACVALVALLLVAAVAEACPGCKDSLSETDPTKSGIVKGYFYSILFMMGMPYTLLSIFCATMYFKVRRLRAAEQAKKEAAEAAQRSQAAETRAPQVDENQPVEV